jgi:hypothetical protein
MDLVNKSGKFEKKFEGFTGNPSCSHVVIFECIGISISLIFTHI